MQTKYKGIIKIRRFFLTNWKVPFFEWWVSQGGSKFGGGSAHFDRAGVIGWLFRMDGHSRFPAISNKCKIEHACQFKSTK